MFNAIIEMTASAVDWIVSYVEKALPPPPGNRKDSPVDSTSIGNG